MDDPLLLLRFDPAAVAVEASSDQQCLNNLKRFAQKLEEFVDLLLEYSDGSRKEQAAVAVMAKNVAATVTPPPPGVQNKADNSKDSSSKEKEGPEPASQKETDIPQPPQTTTGLKHTLDTLKNKDSRPLKMSRISLNSGRSLKNSQLRRSVGKNRKILNHHLKDLGLKAMFGQTTISSYNNTVSHITLNSKWNEIPLDESQHLELWLGEGTTRLKQASKLDPSQSEQSPIPIFWAAPSGARGGAACYYVGHYRCVKFQRFAGDEKEGGPSTTTTRLFKGMPRQALIEFQFVQFDESLDQRIASLPSAVI